MESVLHSQSLPFTSAELQRDVYFNPILCKSWDFPYTHVLDGRKSIVFALFSSITFFNLSCLLRKFAGIEVRKQRSQYISNSVKLK